MFLCMNTGMAFLKLFQVIEIFGIFYYIPTQFNQILETHLEFLHELSDLIGLDEDLFMSKPEYEGTKYLYKLSDDQVPTNIFRSFSLMAILYLIVFVLKWLLKLLNFAAPVSLTPAAEGEKHLTWVQKMIKNKGQGKG